MTERPPTRYDLVPYTSLPYPQTHPAHIGLIGRLFGLNTTPVDRCHVLEIGCAGGGNIIPMAQMFPDSTFIGVDAAVTELKDGWALIAQMGLTNVDLRHCPIEDLPEDLGIFDYILCHGVFSWVPEAARLKILAVIRRHLAPHGVAYVSWNVLPGWRMRGMVRDAMLYHVRHLETYEEQVGQARAMIQFIAESAWSESPYAAYFKDEAEMLRTKADWYLYHDFLADINEPMFFWQFNQLANDASLRYLGEADFHLMLPTALTKEVQESLGRICPSIHEMEQYLDFIRNRAFRRTLLCHWERDLDRHVTWESFGEAWVSTRILLPEGADDRGVDNTEKEAFKVGMDSTPVDSDVPVIKAAFRVMSRVWPGFILFEDLYQRAVAQLPSEPADGRDLLGGNILTLYSSGILEIKTWPFPFLNAVTTHPRASAVARAQAARGDRLITNLCHESVSVDSLERRLLVRLTGEHHAAEVIQAVLEEATQEELDSLLPEGKVEDRGLAQVEALRNKLVEAAENSLLEA